MDFIKVITSKTTYKEVEKDGERYIVHCLPEENNEDTLICVEVVLSHMPTGDELAGIKATAEAYYADINHKAAQRAIVAEVRELKQKLSDTDYIAIKYAEGWISAEEYAPTRAERQQWRDRINELQNAGTEAE